MITRIVLAMMALAVASSAYALDLSDLRPEWTPEGKKLVIASEAKRSLGVATNFKRLPRRASPSSQ